MTTDIIIIDDAVPLATQQALETLFTGPTVPWSFVAPGADYNSVSISTPQSIDYTQLVNCVYSAADGVVGSSFPMFVPVLSALPNIGELLRIKVNITMASVNRPVGSYGQPHIDFTPIPKGLVTAIYYVNDSDGDTVMFNQVGNTVVPVQTITPKKGRLVVFNGGRYHSGNCPSTDQPRVIANINFLPAKAYNGKT